MLPGQPWLGPHGPSSHKARAPECRDVDLSSLHHPLKKMAHEIRMSSGPF